MRDYIEIGRGREARQAYSLDDISIVPNRRTRSSQDVDTSWKCDAYEFDIPLISAASDSLTSPEFIGEMHRLGGMCAVDAEGLMGRVEDIPGAIETILETANDSDVYSELHNPSASVLQQLHAQPLDHDLLTQRIREIRDGGATTVVRLSPQNARELAPVVIAAGAEILVIQGTLLSAEHVSAGGGEPLNLKEFIGSLDVPVIAGSVQDYTTAMHLMRTGAVGVIVGSSRNTNDLTLGIDMPQATAIADAAAARRDYLDETGGRYVHVISGGEVESSGDIAKAMACGADAVIVGHLLAEAQEAAASGYYWPSTAAHPRFPRGFVEPVAAELRDGNADDAEPITLEQVLFGPSSSPFGKLNLVGGLRRSMAKSGYVDLKSFQKVSLSFRHREF